MVAITHSDRKDQCGHESNDHCRDQSSRNSHCRIGTLLSQVYGAIEAGEYKVGVDETGEKDNTIGRPAGRVDELLPYKIAALFRVGLGEAGDCYYEESYERKKDCNDLKTQSQQDAREQK